MAIPSAASASIGGQFHGVTWSLVEPLSELRALSTVGVLDDFDQPACFQSEADRRLVWHTLEVRTLAACFSTSVEVEATGGSRIHAISLAVCPPSGRVDRKVLDRSLASFPSILARAISVSRV